jgi:translation initiation factor 2B subunit (eIF-2B alpha/beta/delta family)
LWWLCAQALSALDPFERLYELESEIDKDATTDHLLAQIGDAQMVCIIGWSPTALEALVQRGDCKALVIDSFGSADSAVNALERVEVEAESVSIEHAARAIDMCDMVVLDALGCGPDEFLMTSGSHGVAALAYVAQKPALVTARRGTRLPAELWEAMKSRNFDSQRPWRTEVDVVPRELLRAVVGPMGIVDTSLSVVAECAPTTEMLVRSAM